MAKNIHNFDHDQIFDLISKFDYAIYSSCKNSNGVQYVIMILDYVKSYENLLSFFIEKIKPYVSDLIFDQYGVKIISKIIFQSSLPYVIFIFNFIFENYFKLAINKNSLNLVLNLHSYPNMFIQKKFLYLYKCNLKQFICDTDGCYFIQNIIMLGNMEINFETTTLILNNFIEFAQHKFASEVIEILIDFGHPCIRKQFIDFPYHPKMIEILLFDTNGNYSKI